MLLFVYKAMASFLCFFNVVYCTMACTVLSFVIKRSISVVHEMKHDTVLYLFGKAVSRTTFEDNFNCYTNKSNDDNFRAIY